MGRCGFTAIDWIMLDAILSVLRCVLYDLANRIDFLFADTCRESYWKRYSPEQRIVSTFRIMPRMRANGANWFEDWWDKF